MNESSPKKMNYAGKSIEKRIFTTEKSDRKLQARAMNLGSQNMSLKNIENMHKNPIMETPSTAITE